jgi:hypothetical protein
VFLLVYKNKLSEILNSMSRFAYAFGVCRDSPAKNINTRYQFLTGILILSGNENKSNDQNDGSVGVCGDYGNHGTGASNYCLSV